ncbi:putative sugar transporter [Thozetella sp. PMI_491]|nr:putative sugar transporter [Thozetella sp. PMI_491]
MGNPFAIKEDPHHPVPKEAYGWRIYALACSASWGSAMFGYDSAFIGSTMSLTSFVKSFDLNGPDATSLSSNITSTFQAGAFFGAIFGYFVGESLGRRWNLLLSALVFLLGAVLQTVCQGAGQLGLMYAGRALTGMGVGASSLIVPIYIAESSPHTIRGRLIGIFEIFLQTASLCGFWVTYGVNQNLPSNTMQWRIPFAVQIIPVALLIICMSFMIESPRWLVKNGKFDLARKNLSWVRNLPADHPYVESELAQMKSQLDAEAEYGRGTSQIKAAWKELSSKRLRFRVCFAMAMKWMSNLAGVNALNYYTPTIFKSIGFTGTSVGLLATGVYGVVKVVVTTVFLFWFVDRWGRRPALLTGSAVIFFSFFYLGTYSKISGSFDASPPRDGGAYMAIIMIYIYAASFSMSWNTGPWIFSAEVFPTKIRSLGMLVAVLNQWLAQYVIVLVTPYMIKDIKYGTFYFFGAGIFVSGVSVYFFMPETKGFSLEEMGMIFENGEWFAPKMRAVGEQLRAERDPVTAAESGKGDFAVTEHEE